MLDLPGVEPANAHEHVDRCDEPTRVQGGLRGRGDPAFQLGAGRGSWSRPAGTDHLRDINVRWAAVGRTLGTSHQVRIVPGQLVDHAEVRRSSASAQTMVFGP
jgi:hypothetical protein